MRNLKRELELERGIRKELEQAKKLLERECHEREQAVQILRQQASRAIGDAIMIYMRLSALVRLDPRLTVERGR